MVGRKNPPPPGFEGLKYKPTSANWGGLREMVRWKAREDGMGRPSGKFTNGEGRAVGRVERI